MRVSLILAALLVNLGQAVVVPRADCSALDPSATDTLAGRFTYAAYDPATNTTTPLFLQSTGSIPHQSWSVLVTSADGSFTGHSLSGGALQAYASDPHFAPTFNTGLTRGNPNRYGQSGPWPTWYTNGAIPDTVFCAVPNDIGTVLAMTGQTDLFSICASYINNGHQTALLYDADYEQWPNADWYDGHTCIPVQVVLVPQ